MPKAFLKIDAEFAVKPGENVEDDRSQLCAAVVEACELEIGISEEQPNSATTFSITPSSMIEGNLDISASGDRLLVKAQGIAQVSVATKHMDTFLSSTGTWRFTGLGGPWLGEFEVDGLQRVDYKTIRFGEEIEYHYWKLEVTTGKTKKL